MWNPCICQGLSIRMFTCPTKLILADMRNTKQCIPAIFLSRLVWNVPRRQTGHDLSAHNTHKQTNKTPTHTHPHLQSWSVSPISDLLRKTSDFPSCESDSRTKIQGLVVTINKRSQSCVKAGPVCVCVCLRLIPTYDDPSNTAINFLVAKLATSSRPLFSVVAIASVSETPTGVGSGAESPFEVTLHS